MADDNMDMDSRKRKAEEITASADDAADASAAKKPKLEEGSCDRLQPITRVHFLFKTRSHPKNFCIAAAEPGDHLHAVRKQIEFYFSDSNYPRDRHLLEKASENNGCILFPLWTAQT